MKRIWTGYRMKKYSKKRENEKRRKRKGGKSFEKGLVARGKGRRKGVPKQGGI